MAGYGGNSSGGGGGFGGSGSGTGTANYKADVKDWEGKVGKYSDLVGQMNNLKRFQLEDLIKQQSVAEHSFGVAMYVLYLIHFLRQEFPEEEEIKDLDIKDLM